VDYIQIQSEFHNSKVYLIEDPPTTIARTLRVYLERAFEIPYRRQDVPNWTFAVIIALISEPGSCCQQRGASTGPDLQPTTMLSE
jgi:hypothetical protein